jgi:hypothetical protein
MVRAYLALSARETMAFMSLSIRLCHRPGTSRPMGPMYARRPRSAMIRTPHDMTETPDRRRSMDALSDILRVARLSGGVFFNAEFSAPWCIAAQMAPELCAPFLGAADHLIPYHYVVDGEMQVALPNQQPQRLRSGEVVLFPRNDFHLIGSDVSLPPVSAAAVILAGGNRIVQTVRHGGGGDAAHMVCGFLGCDGNLIIPIVSTLPPSLILKVDETPAADWIRSTFQYAAHEVADGRPVPRRSCPNFRSCCLSRPCSTTCGASPTGKPAGLPDCAIPPFPGHWRSCTQTWRTPGALRSSHARPHYPAPASPKDSPA